MKTVNAGVAVLAAACVVLWLTHPGGAYSLSGRQWASGSTIAMHLQQGSPTGTLIDGSTSWNAVSEGALALWNPFLNDVSFGVVRDSTEGKARDNDVNNVFWNDDVYGDAFGDDVLAVTLILYRVSDSSLIETDVIFNQGKSWNSYRGNLRDSSGGGRLYDLRRVALHEFGHVLGLGHPDEEGQSVTAIMNSHIGNVDGLRADDTDGARAIYGTSPSMDQLQSGSRLLPGESLTSTSGRYRLLYQLDGNLVLDDDVEEVQLWTTGTAGTSAGQAVMQSDGNFVLYDSQMTPGWFTGTGGNANASLVVQNDGNLVVYSADGQALWDRISASTPAPTPDPTPTPTPGDTSVIDEGSSSLGPLTRLTVPFTTSAAGTIGATVDWTFATNDVDIYLARGNNLCTIDQFNNNQCQFLGSTTSVSTKPETLSVSNLTAGPYTMYIVNWGSTQESVGYQITLAGPPGASASSTPRTSVGGIKGVLSAESSHSSDRR